MTKKQPRVPEMREDPRPNREQRRHPERFERPEDAPVARDVDVPDQQVQGPQDVADARAKNSGHKKKTAENWNQ